MEPLKAQDYGYAWPVCAELARMQLRVSAILNGDCPGEVYVGDITHPQVAYLVSGDGHYLAGSTDNRVSSRCLPGEGPGLLPGPRGADRKLVAG
jgi:hypothetical protein